MFEKAHSHERTISESVSFEEGTSLDLSADSQSDLQFFSSSAGETSEARPLLLNGDPGYGSKAAGSLGDGIADGGSSQGPNVAPGPRSGRLQRYFLIVL